MLAHFRKFDWVLIFSALGLVCLGLISIYSSSLSRQNFFNFEKQLLFLAVSLVLFAASSFFDWRIFRHNPYLILILYFFCVLGLAGLLFLAPEIKGVKSWYKLGPFSLDPIEFTKIILIILLAKFFSMRHVEMYKIRHILLSGFYFLLPIVLIFLQPNLGPILILLFLWVVILIISGIKLRHFFLLVFLGLAFFVFSWMFLLKPYQKERIVSFAAPKAAQFLTTGWNQNQAKIAIGNGGIFGKGIGKGSQTQYGFLPAPQTDFVFAAIAEEMGFVGVILMFFLFCLFVWRCLKIALVCQSNFPRFFAVGLATVVFAQVFINVGMNLGILPIVGISLPFVSYGGSGLVSFFVAVGLLQNIKTGL